MTDMRTILKTLMDSHSHTGHSLEDLCGVPAGTTYRFLKGKHGEPRNATIRKWAKFYGLTEAQLRGYEPIQGVLIPEGEQTSDTAGLTHLTREEKTLLKIMRGIGKEATKRAWMKIGIDLSNGSLTEEERVEVRAQSGFAKHGDRRKGERRCNLTSNVNYRRGNDQRPHSSGKEQQQAS